CPVLRVIWLEGQSPVGRREGIMTAPEAGQRPALACPGRVAAWIESEGAIRSEVGVALVQQIAVGRRQPGQGVGRGRRQLRGALEQGQRLFTVASGECRRAASEQVVEALAWQWGCGGSA